MDRFQIRVHGGKAVSVMASTIKGAENKFKELGIETSGKHFIRYGVKKTTDGYFKK